MLAVASTGKHNSRRRPLSFILPLGLLLFAAATTWARVPEPYALEAVKLQASSKLSKTLTDALDPQGVRIFTYENGVRMNVCDIFWAKSLTGQDTPASPSKLVYDILKPGTLVGLVHFLPEADQEYRKDFRDQKLKPGYYTLRYGVLDAGIGEHGPEPGDFVVLSPATLDRDAARVPPKSELIRLSCLASHTKEPAVMSLIEVTTARKKFPDISTDYAGTAVLQLKLHLKPKKGAPLQDLAMAIVVLTPLVEGEGS